MNTARVETLAWVLIFGGLLAVGLGVALLQAGAGWGWAAIVLGAVGTVGGSVLVWVRSRMDEPPR